MVAGSADHPDRVDRSPYCVRRQFGACAIHIYAILNMQKNEKPEKAEKPVETMLVLAMACLVGYVAWHWKAVLYLSLGFGATGIFSPYLSARITRIWMGLARLSGKITNGVLLSAVFVLVVMPVAIFRRIRGRDRLTRFDPKATSNFVLRDHLFMEGDLEKTW